MGNESADAGAKAALAIANKDMLTDIPQRRQGKGKPVSSTQSQN